METTLELMHKTEYYLYLCTAYLIALRNVHDAGGKPYTLIMLETEKRNKLCTAMGVGRITLDKAVELLNLPDEPATLNYKELGVELFNKIHFIKRSNRLGDEVLPSGHAVSRRCSPVLVH